MVYSTMAQADLEQSVKLAESLWPNENTDDLRRHFNDILHNDNWITFLCKTEAGDPIAFANISIRVDYVEGSTTSPVGYIEGIYVNPKFRHIGIAKELARLGEVWSRSKGCSEYASDTESHNTESQEFHQHIGFDVAETIVHYIKKI